MPSRDIKNPFPSLPAVGAFGLDFPESYGQPGPSYRSREAHPLIYLAL
jgi:hypothetical protein